MPVQAGKYEWSSGEDESEEIKAVGALEMKLRWELDFFVIAGMVGWNTQPFQWEFQDPKITTKYGLIWY